MRRYYAMVIFKPASFLIFKRYTLQYKCMNYFQSFTHTRSCLYIQLTSVVVQNHVSRSRRMESQYLVSKPVWRVVVPQYCRIEFSKQILRFARNSKVKLLHKYSKPKWIPVYVWKRPLIEWAFTNNCVLSRK